MSSEIRYPDYDRSLLALTASVLKYYGVCDYGHTTLPEMDSLLGQGADRVIVIVLSGMGTANLNRHLSETDFLRANKVCDLSAVFPSSTAAAERGIPAGAFLAWKRPLFSRGGSKHLAFLQSGAGDAEEGSEL